MTAPSSGIEQARALVAGMWDWSVNNARLALKQWPSFLRDTPAHVAAAQFVVDLEKQVRRTNDELEVEQARRARAEKAGRA
jgi:hypothetical protein